MLRDIVGRELSRRSLEIFVIQLFVGGEFAGQVEATRANPYLSKIGRLVGSASTLK